MLADGDGRAHPRMEAALIAAGAAWEERTRAGDELLHAVGTTRTLALASVCAVVHSGTVGALPTRGVQRRDDAAAELRDARERVTPSAVAANLDKPAAVDVVAADAGVELPGLVAAVGDRASLNSCNVTLPVFDRSSPRRTSPDRNGPARGRRETFRPGGDERGRAIAAKPARSRCAAPPADVV